MDGEAGIAILIPLNALARGLCPEAPERLRTWYKRGILPLERGSEGGGVRIDGPTLVALTACAAMAAAGEARGRQLKDLWMLVRGALMAAEPRRDRHVLLAVDPAGVCRSLVLDPHDLPSLMKTIRILDGWTLFSLTGALRDAEAALERIRAGAQRAVQVLRELDLATFSMN
ncbi:MAG: hypothetical protein JXA90_16790 [Planctomycetes bacterium]|nr:hypothetical protein [Planctomycetota bacterium]